MALHRQDTRILKVGTLLELRTLKLARLGLTFFQFQIEERFIERRQPRPSQILEESIHQEVAGNRIAHQV